MNTIADHILDICQNSIRAKATLIEIIIEEDKNIDLYKLEIIDNGFGMDPEVSAKAANPFFTSRNTRKVGLGLALLKQNAEQTGGSVTLESIPGEGTKVKATFKHSHIDRLPVGDIAEVILLLMISNKNLTFNYCHKTGHGSFNFEGGKVREICVNLDNKKVRDSVYEYIINNQEDIKISK